jgi:hypothetical protein
MPARRPKKTTPRRTAFVPRGLFVGALATASVIPLVACGGSVQGSGDPDTGIVFGVAKQGFEAGTNDAGTDTGIVFTVAACSFDGDICNPVAACGFDGSPCFVADAGFTDASVADVGFSDGGSFDGPSVAADAFGFDGDQGDVIFTVAACSFDGSVGICGTGTGTGEGNGTGTGTGGGNGTGGGSGTGGS